MKSFILIRSAVHCVSGKTACALFFFGGGIGMK